MSPSATATSGVAGLDGRPYDTVVIGGGILGAGVARELARRGHATLLVERRDFAWGTTARSTMPPSGIARPGCAAPRGRSAASPG